MEKKKQEIKKKGKANETSSVATGEGLVARQGHLVINEDVSGSYHLSDIDPIISASTDKLRN